MADIMEVQHLYGGSVGSVDSLNGNIDTTYQDSATFTPHVSEDGTLSWTNDKGYPNPDPVNLKGPIGATGATGNGILKTEKISTVDTVDTYRITYTNGLTFDYDIHNGEVTQAQLDETNQAIDYYKSTLNALPKVEGEGTSLTLEDTAEAPMKMSLGANMEQASTTGKNLYSGGDKTFTQSITFDIEPIPAGTYVLSGNIVSSDTDQTISLMAFFKDNTQVGFKNCPRGNINTTITLNDVANKVTLYASNGAVTSEGDTATFSNIMISTEGGDYEPYTGGTASPNPDYPQDIHTISGDNTIEIQNINIADEDLIFGTYYELDDDDYYMANSSSLYSRYKTSAGGFPIYFNENSQYTFSCNIYIASGTSANAYTFRFDYTDGTYSTKSGNSLTPQLFEFTSTAGKIVKMFSFTYNNSRQLKIKNFQVIKGNANVSFVPHKEKLLPLNLGVENYFNINAEKQELTFTYKYEYNLEPNTDYTISSNNPVTTLPNIYINTTTGNVGVNINNPITVTTDENGYFYMLVRYKATANDPQTFNLYEKILDGTYYIQVEIGDKANSYTPYGTQPLEYSKIGDYEDEFMIPSGKNKLPQGVNFNEIRANRTFTSNNGQYTISGSGVATSSKIPLKNDYVIKENDYLHVMNNNSTVEILGYSGNTRIFDLAARENNKILSLNNFVGLTLTSIAFYVPNNTTEYILTPMIINNVSSATEYEPYNNGKWYLKKNVGKVVLDGTENIRSDELTNCYRFQVQNIYGISVTSNDRGKSNILKTVLWNYDQDRESWYIDSANLVFKISKKTIDNYSGETLIDKLKNYINAMGNIIFYGKTNKLQYIPLNDTLQSQLNEIYKWVKAYQDQTNISQVNNDLPFVIKASAVKDLNKVIALLTNAIIEVGGEVQ